MVVGWHPHAYFYELKTWLQQRQSLQADPAVWLPDLHQRLEQDLKRFQAPEERARIACGPGCGHCCRVHVAVLEPEIVPVMDYLQSYSAAQQQCLWQRVRDVQQAIRYLDEEERILTHQKCPFLDSQGNCSIYPVRPLLCRGITSTSVAACRESLVREVFGETHQVEMNLVQRKLYETAFEVVAALQLEQQKNPRSQEITCLLLHQWGCR